MGNSRAFEDQDEISAPNCGAICLSKTHPKLQEDGLDVCNRIRIWDAQITAGRSKLKSHQALTEVHTEVHMPDLSKNLQICSPSLCATIHLLKGCTMDVLQGVVHTKSESGML